MSVALTAAEYGAACGYAGRWLEEERPELVPAGQAVRASCGIYIVCAACSRSGVPRVLYVGKADRRGRGGDVGDRLADHLRSSKAPLVQQVAVIPLRPDTPPDEVERIEGDIARYFGVPRLCKKVPGGRRRGHLSGASASATSVSPR